MNNFYFEDLDPTISDIQETLRYYPDLLHDDDINFGRELLDEKADRMERVGQSALIADLLGQEVV